MASSHSQRGAPKMFKDPIHGQIELPAKCVEIIDTPEFQRLRSICQLGGNYHVYPGTCHNRFEHSLGVCYLAGKWFNRLTSRQPDLYTLTAEEQDLKKQHLLCVQIAGLCHDLGHGPFSHVFQDRFLPEILNVPKKHEDISVDMFGYLLDTNGIKLDENDNDKLVQLVCFLIKPRTEWREEEFKHLFGNGNLFISQIVSNNETGIDVDKFDYFARDCHQLGFENPFDHERLMMLALVDREKAHICFPVEKRDNLYRMFETRNMLHKRAYKHRTSTAVEQMLSDAMLKVKDIIKFPKASGESLVPLSECTDKSNMDIFTMVNDHVVSIIKATSLEGPQPLSEDEANKKKALAEAKQILRRIDKRQLYKLLGEARLKECKYVDKDKIIKEIQSKMDEDEKDKCLVQVIEFNCGFNYKEPYWDPISKVQFYRKNGGQYPEIEKAMASSQAEKLKGEVFVRVYCRDTESGSLDKVKAAFTDWLCEHSTEWDN